MDKKSRSLSPQRTYFDVDKKRAEDLIKALAVLQFTTNKEQSMIYSQDSTVTLNHR